MKKRNKKVRKPKKQNGPRPPTPAVVGPTEPQAEPPPRPVEPLTRRALRFLKSPFGIVIQTLGVFASLLAIWEGYWSTRPEIRALSPDASSAFAVPFAVKNPSHFFSMNDVQWFCGIQKIEFSNGASLAKLSISESAIPSIGPGDTRNFRCRIGARSEDVKTGSLSLFVKYKTFYIPRVSSEQPMTWIPGANPPRWVDGEIGGLQAK